MWKVCLLLLVTPCFPPVCLARGPSLIYNHGFRQHKSLEEHVEDGQVSQNEDDGDEVTKILFSLDEPVGEEERNEKSLLNTFPFNQDTDHHGNHAHAHEGHHVHDHQHADHSGHHGHDTHGVHENHPHHTTHVHNEIEDREVAQFPFGERLSNRNSVLGQSQTNFPFPISETEFRQTKTGDDKNDDNAEEEFSLNTIVKDGSNENGRKCIDKVMMVEETVYDEVITCDHSYDKRCHTSYVTNYESQQEEECEENFKKVCMISYEDLAYNSTVEICRTPVVKDCDIPGEQVCQTVYESECSTVQIVHEVEDDVTNCKTEQMKKCKEVVEGYTTRQDCDEWPVQKCSIEKKKVKKYTPETKCYKQPKQMCASRGCGFRNGAIECHEKVKTIVVENPVETCEVEPVRTCKHVTKLVPKLVPVQECADVPKEICARSKTNPKKIKKPVIKKWCYVPSKESGLL